MSIGANQINHSHTLPRPRPAIVDHAIIDLSSELARLKPPAPIKKPAAIPEILWLTRGLSNARHRREFGKQTVISIAGCSAFLGFFFKYPNPGVPIQIAMIASLLAPIWVMKNQLTELYHMMDRLGIDIINRYWPKQITQSQQQEAISKSFNKPRSVLRTSATRDIERYFRSLPGHYIRQVESAAKELGPLKAENRISVIVPVAAHEEQDGILSLLHAAANQRMSPQYFDLNLFLNYPAQHAEKQRSAIAATIRSVETARSLYPNLQINSFVRAIAEGFSIGFMRKLATDARLLTALVAGRPDLKLLRWDADTRAVHPQALQTFDDYLSRTPLFGVAIGRHRYDIPSLMHDPVALFGEWLWQSLRLTLRHEAPQGGPPNSATVAWRYAVKGGYDPHAKQAEDVALDRSLIDVSEPLLQEILLPATATVWTDGRRLIAAHDKGFASHEQWTACHFGDDNQSIRSNSATNQPVNVQGFLAKLGDPKTEPRLIEQIEKAANPWLISSGSLDRVERRLGFKCQFGADGRIKSLKWDNLRKYLQRFAINAESNWKKILEAK